MTKELNLYNFALQLKKEGFKVFTKHYQSLNGEFNPENNGVPYFHFSKDGVLWGYCQPNYYGGYSFSIDYKPTRSHGSGRQILDMVDITIKNAERTLSLGYRYAKEIGFYNPASCSVCKHDPNIVKHL
jgi:hypothetical protein